MLWSRHEYLRKHHLLAFFDLDVGCDYVVHDDPLLPPAWTTGIIRPVLHLNQAHLREMGTVRRAFIVEHEKYHVIHRHGLWSLVTLVLLLPFWPLIRREMEVAADRFAGRRVFQSEPQASVALRPLEGSGLWGRWLYGRNGRARARRIFA